MVGEVAGDSDGVAVAEGDSLGVSVGAGEVEGSGVAVVGGSMVTVCVSLQPLLPVSENVLYSVSLPQMSGVPWVVT